jgi:hypothetical protein
MSVAVVIEQLSIASPTLGPPYRGSVMVRIYYPLNAPNPQDGDTSIEMRLMFENELTHEGALRSALDQLEELGHDIVKAVAKARVERFDANERF